MLFEARNASVTINNQVVLNDVSFSVDRGEVVGVIGPNGAGKSTLLKVASGLLQPTHGEVLLNDKSYSVSFQEFRRQIGFMIEEPSVYSYLTGKEHLKLLLKYQGLETTADVLDIGEKLGINFFLNKKIRNYSLGMRQRLGIASSLIHNPDFVILDEPTNSLDIHGIKEIRELINELKDNRKGILLSSHMLYEVEEMCDKIIVIQKGKVVDSFNRNQHSSSQHDYIITLSGGDNTLLYIKNRYQAAVRGDKTLVTITHNDLHSVIQELINNKCTIIDIEKKTRKLEQIYFDKVGHNEQSYTN